MKLSRRGILQLAIVPTLLSRAEAADLAATTSRVYPGPDGKLVYVPDQQGDMSMTRPTPAMEAVASRSRRLR
jgi:hypothetical protein